MFKYIRFCMFFMMGQSIQGSHYEPAIIFALWNQEHDFYSSVYRGSVHSLFQNDQGNYHSVIKKDNKVTALFYFVPGSGWYRANEITDCIMG